MKLPLILAHGTELMVLYVVAICVGYLLAGFSCWLAFRKKKIAALVVSVPAIAVGALLASAVHLLVGWLPLVGALVAVVVALFSRTAKSTDKNA
jgi:hypothetical protein